MAKTSVSDSSATGADNQNTSVQTSAQPEPAPALPSWITDEHAGIGGDYELDPATGKRTRVGGAELPPTVA